MVLRLDLNLNSGRIRTCVVSLHRPTLTMEVTRITELREMVKQRSKGGTPEISCLCKNGPLPSSPQRSNSGELLDDDLSSFGC